MFAFMFDSTIVLRTKLFLTKAPLDPSAYAMRTYALARRGARHHTHAYS